ncbi:TolC family protein [Cellulosilyticum lentocellum]|uniref:Outer membrane efflux protein n=1 Tax=Cellulosilyticum lentocellum (strain ATCC 49066 / DSM 5427 / NCIMB 11756 / RHM5) TaxID=642492 RepID=F2JLV8_CELLD|nr:TolC family protein [Cellulosilyticum lentocellum]ADZ84634.1 hypothetical protein Clole_2937 [Cellulosilyticum lentocellum DSM 5427]
MKLNKGIKKALLLLSVTSLITTSVLAAPVTEKKELDLDYAITMAISKDETLGEYARNTAVYTEQKKSIENIGSVEYSSKKIAIEELNQKKQFQKDRITKEVTEQYQNIVLLQRNIELLKKQINLNENQVKQVTIKKEKGFCDELTYEQAVQSLEESKVKKEQTEKNLGDAKKSFLNLTNINTDNYILKEENTYEPFVLDQSINSYATAMATKLLKYENEKVNLSEDDFKENIYKSGVGGTGPKYSDYLEQKINVENSKVKLQTSYDKYRLLIETQYTVLSAQLDSINTKANEYKNSVKEMKALEIKYKAGYISTLDYETQKVALDAKQVDYLNEVYKYNILKMQFEKPWTMSEYSF